MPFGMTSTVFAAMLHGNLYGIKNVCSQMLNLLLCHIIDVTLRLLGGYKTIYRLRKACRAIRFLWYAGGAARRNINDGSTLGR